MQLELCLNKKIVGKYLEGSNARDHEDRKFKPPTSYAIEEKKLLLIDLNCMLTIYWLTI